MSSNDRVFILADDFTGALEVGAKFGGHGIATSVTTAMNCSDARWDSSTQAMVVDTQTRHLTPGEAAARVFAWVREACENGFARTYKKTDSTLRGNIASELEALLKAWPGSPLIYSPAYPAMGRTVRNGTLFVHGVPVAKTDFAQDRLNPVRESHIPTLLRSQSSVPVFPISCEAVDKTGPCGVYVCDAETDDEVAQIAAAVARSDKLRLAAGPAAFAGSLAAVMTPAQPPPALPRGLRTGLVVCGSLNQVSLQQVRLAAQSGFAVAGPAGIPQKLAESGWAILQIGDRTAETAFAFAERAGEVVCEILGRSRPDVLVVLGGDTAYAIIRRLDVPSIRPLGEIMEGIPVCSIEAGPDSEGFFLITKAGGFGPPDALVSIRKIVSGE